MNKGNIIAELRREAGYTQKSLADALHITDKAVSKWERGLSLPDVALLPRLSLLLDADVELLLSQNKLHKGWVGLLDLRTSTADLSRPVYDKPMVYYMLSHYLLLDIREISPQSVPINFLLPIKGTRLADKNPPRLTTEYCIKVLCLARLMLPKADIRCAAGREVYFTGREETLFGIVDSIFAAGYLTAGGQGIDDTLRLIASLGYEGTVESTGE